LDTQEDGRFTIKNGARTLYSDLSDAEAKLWEPRLIPQSYKVQTTPATRAAYEYLPSTYLICENDKAVPLQFQRMFAAMANAQVESCDAGHSPMLSQPGMLVARIAGVVYRAVAAERHVQVALLWERNLHPRLFLVVGNCGGCRCCELGCVISNQ
jgi:pimeloyl-ACP methyl ester carboxylesterase